MRLHWIVAFAVGIGAAGAAWHYTKFDVLLCWLASINAVTFATYGYDKAIAGSQRRRIPERLLLSLAVSGGSPCAYLGMQIFRHKTSKASFRWRFWLVVALQGALVAAYFVWLEPMIASR